MYLILRGQKGKERNIKQEGQLKANGRYQPDNISTCVESKWIRYFK